MELITAFKNKLLICICIVLVLLAVCVCVDYADENITINNTANSMIKVNDTDNVLLVDDNLIEPNPKKDKVYKVKKNVREQKLPLITITAKPSVRSNYAYKWYTTTWVDYCPHCHRYNVLYNAHKYPARFEQELTCKVCSADYCGVTGKEKYSWSRVYLRRS